MNKIDFRDLLLLLGGGFFSYGVFLIYEPAMYIVLGSVFMFVGWPKRR